MNMKITKEDNVFNFKKEIRLFLAKLSLKAINVVVLTIMAGFTIWALAAFTEPSVAPSSSDQDFAQNILGNNDSNNDFDSTNVAANRDGSLVERAEKLQTDIGAASDAAATSTTLFAGQERIAALVVKPYVAICVHLGGEAGAGGYGQCATGWSRVTDPWLASALDNTGTYHEECWICQKD